MKDAVVSAAEIIAAAAAPGADDGGSLATRPLPGFRHDLVEETDDDMNVIAARIVNIALADVLKFEDLYALQGLLQYSALTALDRTGIACSTIRASTR